MDIDGSRRVSYSEFASLLRKELKLSSKTLSQQRLAALWKRLDENASGFVDPGELGRFMKIGAPEGGLGARTRVVMERHAGRRDHMADLDKRHGRDLTKHIQKFDVPAASADEVHRMSTLFNARMVELKPRDAADGRNFYRLFKHMDVDNSGRISYKELMRMVRPRAFPHAHSAHARALSLSRARAPSAPVGAWPSVGCSAARTAGGTAGA